jgi:site-specific recombinase XerD
MRKPFRISSRKAWYIRVDRNDGSGKQSLLKLGATKREADAAWELILRSTAEQTETGEAGGLLVVSLISKYCDWMKSRVESGKLAPSTMSRRVHYFASFLKSINTQLHISELKVHHITDWLLAQKRWNTNTQYYAGVALKRVFNWCISQGYLDKNPLSTLTLDKGESRDFLVDAETFRKLLDGASDPKYQRPHVIAFRTLLTVLSISGCRPSEVANVRVEDWHKDRWVLKKHKTAKKTKRARVVYLCPCLLTLTRIAAGNRKKGPLFMAARSEPWTYSKMRRRFERLKKRVGVDPACVLYSFRHTSITNALVAGVDVSTVAEVHGTSIQMIQMAYGHLCQHQKHLTKAVFTMAKARREV